VNTHAAQWLRSCSELGTIAVVPMRSIQRSEIGYVMRHRQCAERLAAVSQLIAMCVPQTFSVRGRCVRRSTGDSASRAGEEAIAVAKLELRTDVAEEQPPNPPVIGSGDPMPRSANEST
jgi:hypothetical protein